jgi:glucose-6-phosphate isomerase
VNVNAYHQPGVEAGKKMACAVIALQGKVLAHLREDPGKSFTAEEVAQAIGAEDSVESVYKILEHASANKDHQVKKIPGKDAFTARYVTV